MKNVHHDVPAVHFTRLIMAAFLLGNSWQFWHKSLSI